MSGERRLGWCGWSSRPWFGGHGLVGAVVAGERVLRPLTPRAQARAPAQLETSDHSIFAMRLAGTPLADIAATLGNARRELAARLAVMLPRMAPA